MISTELRTITIAEYHQMVAAGILGEDEHVELISGQILNMSPKGIRHSFAIMQLLWELQELLGRRVLNVN
jgi:Uma2 family endonuclease